MEVEVGLAVISYNEEIPELNKLLSLLEVDESIVFITTSVKKKQLKREKQWELVKSPEGHQHRQQLGAKRKGHGKTKQAKGHTSYTPGSF